MATMVSSNRQAFAYILLLLAAASLAHAQKDQTASISGKVTVKNKAVAGIVVAAVETNYGGGWQRPRYRGTTDADGNYRIDKVPSGSYYVFPLAHAFVVDKSQAKQLLAVAAGEAVRDIDFALIRGGVITGKVTGADGQPLVEETVNAIPVDFQPDYNRVSFSFQTDDRGIYRVFGLRQGKYRVSVGTSTNRLPGELRQVYKQTFYPSVTDPEKAAILEVSEGGEIRDVDIEVEPPLSTFKVTGRIIDGETGKPLANVPLGVERKDGNSSISSVGGVGSNKDGEFRLENVMPGHYRLFAAPSDKADWRAEALEFEVVDRDISGLEIRTKKGASLSGVVVLQNSDEKSVAPRLEQLQIFAYIDNPSMRYYGGHGRRVAPDGSFKIGGLPSGHAQLGLFLENRMGSRDIDIVSIEQNGVLEKVINLKDGEQVSGLRVVIRYSNFTGAINGQVKFEDGELPPGSQVFLSVNPLEERPSRLPFSSSGSSPPVDSRGRFILRQLEAGIYEISVSVFVPGQTSYYAPKQQVTVTNNAVSDVTITVKVKP
jgi:hypothetical protein